MSAHVVCLAARRSVAGRFSPLSVVGLLFPFLFAGVLPAATLGHALITNQEVSAGCPVPPPINRFGLSDPLAVVWFEFSGTGVGDVASVRWYTPSGELYRTSSWVPIDEPGDYCFSSVLRIAGQPPQSLPGAWTVQGYWNGERVFTLTFRIGSDSPPLPTEGSGGPGAEAPGDTRSRGRLTFTGFSPRQFNPSRIHGIARLDGAVFGEAEYVRVSINGAAVAATVRPDSVAFDAVLNEGPNSLLFKASDSDGNTLLADVTLWSGARSLRVTVLDEAGAPATGASVVASLGDDRAVAASGTTSAGVVTFTNLPDRTVFLEATANGNRYASLAVTGAAGSAHYRLRAFASPSPVDNNDFSKGLDGWVTNGAPVRLIPHQDDGAGEGAAAHISPAVVAYTARLTPAAAGTQDLELRTSGEGPQSVSRTFRVMPGTQSVTVRYKFITSEVPGGYFGSKYNDYFSVSLRSQGGGLATSSNSMNALGLSAFTPDGAIVWRELTLPVLGGDVLQLDGIVTNVGDGQYDSRLLFQHISESSFAVSKVELREAGYEDSIWIYEPEPLRFLSADTHAYFNGDTLVDGHVTVTGDPDDQLTGLTLEVLDGAAIVAISELQPEARQSLGQTFGSSRMLRVGPTLFRIASDQFAGDKQANREFTLRVRAVSAKGREATGVYGTVKQLAIYSAQNRYPSRDPENCVGTPSAYRCGGDDWVLPEVRRFLEQYQDVRWNDFSNMNAGPFPLHASHDQGVDVDGWFEGYSARDAAVARKLIGMVNLGKERSVRMVFVKFTPEFQNAIANVKLLDGRPAAEVFVNEPGHGGHFHFRLTEHPSMGVPVTLRIENKLLYPARIVVDGQTLGNAPAQSTVEQPFIAGRQLSLSFEVVQPTLSGRPLGDPMAGSFDAISNPAGTLNFTIDNRIGDAWFFVPAIDNRTDVTLLMSVNEGLQAQNRCNCTIAPSSSSAAAGYYRWYSNSNVALFRSSSNYTGKYILFGTDPATRQGSFVNSVQPGSGLLRLTAITPP